MIAVKSKKNIQQHKSPRLVLSFDDIFFHFPTSLDKLQDETENETEFDRNIEAKT